MCRITFYFKHTDLIVIVCDSQCVSSLDSQFKLNPATKETPHSFKGHQLENKLLHGNLHGGLGKLVGTLTRLRFTKIFRKHALSKDALLQY